MNGDLPAPEQLRQQAKRMTGDDLIHEWLLPIKRLKGAATRRGIFTERGIGNLWEELTNRAQPVRFSGIASIPWLAQHELAAIGAVSEVEPVGDRGVSSNQPLDLGARGPRVHATDHNIGLLNLLRLGEVLLDRLPLKAPEQVDPGGENGALAEADFRLAERLAHAVGRRDDVAIDQRDVQTSGMTSQEQRLMDVGKAHSHDAAVAATNDHDNSDSTPMQEVLRNGVPHEMPTVPAR